MINHLALNGNVTHYMDLEIVALLKLMALMLYGMKCFANYPQSAHSVKLKLIQPTLYNNIQT